MTTQVSRMAKGYVRQELRALKKTNGLKVGLDFFQNHKPLVDQYYPRNRRLPERVPQMLVDSFVGDYLPHLLPVGSLPRDLEFPGLRGKACKQANALYWEAHDHAITSLVPGSDVEYDDSTVDLRFTRICADRKRIILDDVAVPVSVSEHVLGRMSERGYEEKTPLAKFSSEMSSWLPLSFAYLLSGLHLEKMFGICIPSGDGIILGTVVAQAIRQTNSEDKTGDWILARRATYDNRGFHITQPPRHDFFRIEDDKTILLRLNTYVAGRQLKWEQEWARDRILAIMKKHEGVLPVITEMIIEGQPPSETDKQAVNGLLVDLITLVEDHVWGDAIRVAA